jgi:diguanylate cyclase (GGDEF)-like protein
LKHSPNATPQGNRIVGGRLNLDSFPDSAYAHELRRGLGTLRFDSPLETEYTFAHLRRVHLRVRVWFSLTLALAVFFTANQVHREGAWNLLSVAHWGVLIPCTGALVYLAWSRLYERFYLPAARILVPLFCVLISVFIAIALTHGKDEQLAQLTVNLVAVFFFAGLLFRQALLSSAVILIAFAVAAIAVGLPSPIFVKSMVIMSLTSGLAAIIYRDVEQAYRRNFLEEALIRELVSRDGLTGLMNRRGFDEHLLRVWQHAFRDQRPLAVLMIDIDHFKGYNDQFGHQAGDVAIRSVAHAIQGFARRPLDVAARYGGEEFAVILYDLAFPHIVDTAERLREAVQNLKMVSDARNTEAYAGVTISVGVGVAIPTIGRTPEGAVQLADEALYEAKQAGRNRVIAKGLEAYRLLNTGTFARRSVAIRGGD